MIISKILNKLRNFYYVLDGRYFNEIKTHIDHTNENIAHLKHYVENNLAHNNLLVGKSDSFAFHQTMTELCNTEPKPNRIAFITNLLPETTGLATFSFYSLLEHTDPMDVFCPVIDSDWFMINKLQLENASEKQTRLYDVKAFLTADNLYHYKKVIIATGNSTHSFYIHDVLEKIGMQGDLARVILYIHDPVLLNLIVVGKKITSAMELKQFIESVYGKLPEEIASKNDYHAVRYLLEKCGIRGTRYFYNMGIKRYFVNSQTASKLLSADINAVDIEITQLFLPIFIAASAKDIAQIKIVPKKEKNGSLVIGSFGILSERKHSDLILKAVKLLRQRDLEFKLILAGFHARTFASNHASLLAEMNVQIFDSPTDLQLLHCMNEVDIAIQLRQHHQGESSGIVSQLLALEKDIIVTDIGTFQEYGPIVKKISPDANEEKLADVIIDLWKNPLSKDAIREYIQAHSSTNFRKKLIEAL